MDALVEAVLAATAVTGAGFIFEPVEVGADEVTTAAMGFGREASSEDTELTW